MAAIDDNVSLDLRLQPRIPPSRQQKVSLTKGGKK